MTQDRCRLRRAFTRPTYLFARVTRHGFESEHEVLEELVGHIVKTHLLRKRFEDGYLACDSRDGLTARDGTRCDACRHPRCLAFLRIHVRDAAVITVLDLAPTAARALLDLTDALEAEQRNLEDVSVRLTVLDRGQWGLVRIERT